MANFYASWDLTKQNEGGYSNDPNDKGGETYRGISRKYNPHWTGWDDIDTLQHPIKTNFTNNILDTKAANYYSAIYWGLGDLIQNQNIANIIFDQSVIGGVGRTNDMIKDILNKYFNSKFALNGSISTVVITKLNSIDAKKFVNIFNRYRRKYFRYSAGVLPIFDPLHSFFKRYNKSSEADRLENIDYLSSWFKRVKRYEIKPSNFVADLLGI